MDLLREIKVKLSTMFLHLLFPSQDDHCWCFLLLVFLYFDLLTRPKMLFQGDAPEGSDTFQWPVIERDRVGGLRLIIWDKVKVPLC